MILTGRAGLEPHHEESKQIQAAAAAGRGMDTLMRTTWHVFAAIAILTLGGGRWLVARAGAMDTGPDARQLKTGRFLHRTMLNGKDAGSGELSIRILPGSGRFVYTDRETGPFSQHWESIAAATFSPVSAKLTFGEGDTAPPAFALSYRDGRVTGFAQRRHGPGPAGRVNVDAAVSPDTVDQRIDWAAAISQRLVPGREFTFHVFDPGTGNSRVTGRIVGPEAVRVPAGSFDAMRIVYRVEKPTGTEVYQVLTQREGPRMLLKEEFPDGAVSELVEEKD